jgi:hAT family C-terminal dimerisation region
MINDGSVYTDRVLQSNRLTYPTIFAIAMDYLPIQASSVPCERVFSSSAETDTKRRNRISPDLMEALQMLKFNLKKERINFMAGWNTSEKQMVDDSPEEDLLQDLLEDSNKWDSVMKKINQYED